MRIVRFAAATGIFLGLVSIALAEQSHFTYNGHGKRDPFAPLVASDGTITANDVDLSVSDMNLEGVLGDPSGNNLAVINGKVLKAGDQLGAYQINAVRATEVDLTKDQEHFTLRLKKGGT